ncbi:MAG: hypothetical protein J7K40_03810 [candidate division Zixibacteria bacterium]|nr:hypothetical protein [candidate division Zixibacteria bacterium]
MRYSVRVIAYILAVIVLFNTAAYCDKINVSAGREIKIKYKSKLSTELEQSKKLSDILEISQNVAIGGIDVFKAGGTVYGEIIKFKKPGRLGKPAVIKVRIDSVQAIGGKNIRVKPVSLSAKGKSKKLKACLLLPLLGYGYFFVRGGHALLGSDEIELTVKTARFAEIAF